MIPPPLNPDAVKRDRWVCARITLITTVLLSLFTTVIWRLSDLQIKKHDHYTALATQMRQRVQKLPAHRGAIRDVNGETLAQDEQVHELYVDRTHIREANVVRKRLADIMGTNVAALAAAMHPDNILRAYHEHIATVLGLAMEREPESLLADFRSTRPETVLKKNIQDEEVPVWRELLEKQKITGVYLRPAVRRDCLAKNRLTNLIGELVDNHGAWGVEKLMDARLTGTPGQQWIERDNKGNELPLYRGKVIEPKDGEDVFLTIDMHLQEYVESVLEQQCLIYNPIKATIVLVEPRTGSILAMASRPHYNRETKSGMFRNIAVADHLEPGSTFKLVAFAAALDARLISPHDEIFCHHGTYDEPGFRKPLLDDEPWGTLSVENVLIHSSNIGTYKIAKKVGVDRFFDYARRLGFGVQPGTGLMNESPGRLSDEKVTNSRFSRLAMGYSVAATPLQIAMMTAAVANGGLLMKPRLVDRAARADGSELEMIAPQVVCQAMKPGTADILRDILVKVVTEGTGKQAALEGVAVAGKTGTSQRYDEEKGVYVEGEYNTSFAGFAPAENPKVACVVVLEAPKAEKSQLYGGKVSAPVFQEVVREALNHLEVGKRQFRVKLAQKGGSL